MTTTVVATALAKEKVWYDKPNYDKAERRYFEKLAKVMSHKIMEGCTLKSNNTISYKCRDLIDTNTLKSKAEKSKDNKLTLENESNELNIKHSKCQGRSAKANKEAADICNMQNKGNIKTTKKSDSSKYNAKEEESTSPIEKSKKYNAKEAKEKKNKEDTRNKNRESEENYIEENKETAMPFTTNKEQLSDQMQAIRFANKPRAGSLANEVAKARQHIKWSLQCMNDIAARADVNEDVAPSDKVENKNEDLRDLVQDLKNSLDTLVQRVKNLEALEQRVESLEARTPYIAICPAKPVESLETEQESEQDKDRKQSKETNDDDVDIDLFNSDSEGEDAEAAKVREERLAAYAAKKSKKPILIAKSNIILDVKPWDDETNMEEMEKAVRNIEIDGLLWGASKLQPLAYSIYKLQISCVVEDDKVSVDMLTERIEEIEEYVQSVDIAAFNKV